MTLSDRIDSAITTAIACFPFVFRQLLGFVGIYGLLLMPVGAMRSVWSVMVTAV